MGLFGDKDVKQLQRLLDSGAIMMKMLASGFSGNRTPEDMVNELGDDIFGAAARLKEKGKGPEASELLRSARAEGEGIAVENWNGLLDQVEAELA